ncbi:hypothetical protein DESACE_08490 [Desulfurella acetivorans A63]|nr:hypothetical protein DESACE_08490 [Desulfurella acetivorans A63]
MKTLKYFARQKENVSVKTLVKETGDYNFKKQRRFIGSNFDLINWSTKSSTIFDGESSTSKADT